jgi:putative membrane protein
MKNLFNFCTVAALSVAFVSCGGGQQDSTRDAKDSNAVKMDSTGSDSSRGTSSIPASVSKDDAQFVVNTANAGMTEIQAGQLAQQQGMAKDVKAYGAMMVKDHTEAADKLKMIAASKNITLPAALSPEAQNDLADLQKKQGKDFDKAYLDKMIDDHKKVISMFETESKSGSDADLRAFADATLHTLHHHLDEAEKCDKMMKKM